jgi:hypothetical protein
MHVALAFHSVGFEQLTASAVFSSCQEGDEINLSHLIFQDVSVVELGSELSNFKHFERSDLLSTCFVSAPDLPG